MVSGVNEPDLYVRLRGDLTEALKNRDRVAVSALRVAVAAIDNAGAVEPGPAMPEDQTPADVPRRRVSREEMAGLVGREVAELAAAVESYEGLGQLGAAEEARARLAVLERYLPPG